MYIPSIVLHVTPQIIAGATRRNSGHCILALALRQRGATSINVTAEMAKFNLPSNLSPLGLMRYRYEVSPRAAATVARFDDGLPIEPFKVELEGRTAAAYPSTPRGPNTGRAGGRKIGGKKIVRSIRRYHGLRVIVKPVAEK